MRIIFKILLFTQLFGVVSCTVRKNLTADSTQKADNQTVQMTRPIVIYKTVKDYSSYVTVIMNDEKTKIVSYPHPSDLYFEGKLSTPIALKNGYWLDVRGITKNVVFLKFTYQEYSKFTEVPSIELLTSSILEKNPLVELVYCPNAGYESSALITNLNTLIEKGLHGCQKEDIVVLSIEL
jgi:hypothetical protein